MEGSANGPITAARQSMLKELVIVGLGINRRGRNGVNLLPAWEVPCCSLLQSKLDMYIHVYVILSGSHIYM